MAQRLRAEFEMVGYPSGQRGQTVNLLAYAFEGSNPSPTTSFCSKHPPWRGVHRVCVRSASSPAGLPFVRR
jgi:hypothetical protein